MGEQANLVFGVLTVSDTCSTDPEANVSGKKLRNAVLDAFPNSKVLERTVPDELDLISGALVSWCDDSKCDGILTTGGTGFAPRDVTPEATKSVIEKEAPGLAYAMVAGSLAITEKAMLSRAVCGIRGRTLIVNLPGSPKGAVECFDIVKSCIPHALDLLNDRKVSVKKAHQDAKGDDTKSKVKLNAVSRHRTSPYPLKEVDDALKIIFQEVSPTIDVEVFPYDKCVGRVLAEDVYSVEPFPPFAASVKDGYAVRSDDKSLVKRVRSVVAAGDKPLEEPLKPGETIRISTGAAVPLGADAVVQVEDTTITKTSPDGCYEEEITIAAIPDKGKDIRAIGCDVPSNTLVLNKFDRLSAAHIGVLALLGKTQVRVFKTVSVGILTTGNEVRTPGEKLEHGQIYDTNKCTLKALLKKYNYSSMDCGVAKDDPDSIKEELSKAFSKNDLVITTGGVSMGEFDVLKQVLIEDFNAYIHFARVNMKPGKPTTFATLKYQGKVKICFGLPGNPVSCCVTSLLFVIPTLRYLERGRVVKFPEISIVSNSGCFKNFDQRPEYQRVMVIRPNDNTQFSMFSTGNQISSRLNSMVGANGLALVPGQHGTNTNQGYSNAYSNTYKVMIFDDIL